MRLVSEMKEHMKKLEEARKHEDPRMSFVSSEFKDAQRKFQQAHKNNFGRPRMYVKYKEFPWSEPVLRRIDELSAEALQQLGLNADGTVALKP